MTSSNDFIPETNRCVCFDIEFEDDSCFCIDFTDDNCFSLDLGELTIIDSLDYYDGEYEVTPDKNSQVLMTSQKSLLTNIFIHPIEYKVIDNDAGGQTVIIGHGQGG